jgi:hypothetical protein
MNTHLRTIIARAPAPLPHKKTTTLMYCRFYKQLVMSYFSLPSRK